MAGFYTAASAATGGSSSSGRQLYTGERGDGFHLFMVEALGDVQLFEMKRNAPLPFDTAVQIIRRHIMPSSDADVVTQRLLQAFASVITQVSYGFWPRYRPPQEVIDYIGTMHPTVHDLHAFIKS